MNCPSPLPSLHLLALSVAASLTLAATVARGADINWNSTIGSNNYTSAGSSAPLGDSFMFELGTFTGGFVPTALNTSQWSAHWAALDRAEYNPQTKFFSSKAALASNDLPFHWSKKAFIWGFSQSAPGEWILAANPSWSWPFADGIQPPVTWSIAAAGTTAIVGSLNGPGFQMQTAQVNSGPPDVAPEAWRQQHFSAAQRGNQSISGWDADPDGDGANNLLELAAGSDPQNPASHPLPSIEIVALGSSSRSLQLALPRTHRAAIRYSAETSNDLTHWSGSATSITTDTPDRLVISCPGATARALFMRFSISLLP